MPKIVLLKCMAGTVSVHCNRKRIKPLLPLWLSFLSHTSGWRIPETTKTTTTLERKRKRKRKRKVSLFLQVYESSQFDDGSQGEERRGERGQIQMREGRIFMKIVPYSLSHERYGVSEWIVASCGVGRDTRLILDLAPFASSERSFDTRHAQFSPSYLNVFLSLSLSLLSSLSRLFLSLFLTFVPLLFGLWSSSSIRLLLLPSGLFSLLSLYSLIFSLEFGLFTFFEYFAY